MAQLTKEYIAGGSYPYMLAGEFTALAQRRDDLFNCVGWETHRRMLKDAEIAKCFTALKVLVLSEGLSVNNPVTPDDARYSKYQKMVVACKASLNNLDRPIEESIEELLDGLAYGYKISEITYELVGGQLLHKSLKGKPPDAAYFLVDEFLNVKGIKGIDSKGKEVFVSRDKAVVFTPMACDNDPRGVSLLEAVFIPWYLKQQLWPEYLKWLIQCAVPIVVGTTAPEDESNYLLNAQGEPILDADGNPVKIAPVDGMLNALLELKNSSAIAIPYEAKVEALHQSQGGGDPFKLAREILNEEIEMRILLQTLATSESRFNTRAAATVHQSILDSLAVRLKEKILQVLLRDFFKPFIRLNFGEKWLSFLPDFSLGDTERRDFSTDGLAVATMFEKKLLLDSQLPAIWRQLGVPIPDNYTIPKIDKATTNLTQNGD